jgi:hypothetical protein
MSLTALRTTRRFAAGPRIVADTQPWSRVPKFYALISTKKGEPESATLDELAEKYGL